jgi:hypothetical protein
MVNSIMYVFFPRLPKVFLNVFNPCVCPRMLMGVDIFLFLAWIVHCNLA